MAPASAAFAGEHGDGLLTVGGQQPHVYEQMLRNFAEGARKVSKDPDKLPRLIELPVEFTDDAATAIESRKRYWAATFLPALFNQKIYTPATAELNGSAVGSDTIKGRACISTDPEQHLRFAQRYVDLGFDHLIFHSAGPDQRAFPRSLRARRHASTPRVRRIGQYCSATYWRDHHDHHYQPQQDYERTTSTAERHVSYRGRYAGGAPRLWRYAAHWPWHLGSAARS
jgi:coenzyme F420-dependent glucose-6-phosphate dehydrogenase